VYRVMLGCWRRDPRERFAFERVHRHLRELTHADGGQATATTDVEHLAEEDAGRTSPSEPPVEVQDDDQQHPHQHDDSTQQQQRRNYCVIDIIVDDSHLSVT